MNTKRTITELNRKDAESFRKAKKIPVKVVLENIRSRSNIGSVFRSADAFLIKEIILCGYTALPPHRDIQKTALGATESVAWRGIADISEAIQELRNTGYKVWGVEQTSKSVSLGGFSFSTNQPVALIFGNEVKGIEQSTVDQCDGTIEIDQFGTKHSLNIAVCAGIILFVANQQLHVTSME